jgi:tetratricopeptide (TPR) repeat protein
VTTVANPRIDDLRKKLDKEPGSRLFAQLAEELRKDGELAEAIRVCRTGLNQHPNYPSARMTLGRALLDSGDLAGARKEFEVVLKGAPDNILASRFLAECLEGLGLAAEALARYKATLVLAPGDKQVMARVLALETPAPPAPPPAAAPAPPPAAAAPVAPPEPAPVAGEPAPIPLAAVDEPLEVVPAFAQGFATPAAAPPHEAPPTTDNDPPPIPLVAVDDEEFELDNSYRTPNTFESPDVRTAESAAVEARWRAEERDVVEVEPEPLEVEPDPAPAPFVPEPDMMDEEFEVEPPPPPSRPQVTFRTIVPEDEDQAAPAGAGLPLPAPAVPASEPELASPTLAELYFDQGFMDKAIEVYRRLLERDPGNKRLSSRLAEIEAVQRHLTAPSGGPAGSRREEIERTIARLQGLRTALARRSP